MLSDYPPDRAGAVQVARVCVMGSTGLIGTALCRALRELGVAVTAYSRGHTSGDLERAHWDPDHGEIDTAPLLSADAVVNLAGEHFMVGRWTRARKEQLASSRLQGTQLLVRALCKLPRRPRVLANASDVGIYGHRGEVTVHEGSPPGNGFLPDLCQEWEAAALRASDCGMRVVLLRLGMVLSRAGGTLAAFLPLFRAGLGTKLGSGQQYVPWVTLHDAVRAIRFAVATEAVQGPVNIVAPEPSRNAEFARALGGALRRPTLLRAPGLALQAAFGEAAREILLSGACARPEALERAGFRFDYPRLADALPYVLGTPG